MNLSDLRKVSVKKHLRIRFSLSNGMECVINEHGIAQVPALRAVPAFNLEEELGGVQTFLLESASPSEKERAKSRARSYSREEVMALASAGSGNEGLHDEHDD